MGTPLDTQEIPRPVDRPSTVPADDRVPHEILFEAAMARIEAMNSAWQEILAGSAAVLLPTTEPTREPTVDQHQGLLATPPPSIPAGTEEVVAARAAASRWRRQLAA